MTFKAEAIKITTACIALVISLAVAVFWISTQFPVKSTLLFMLWAFVAVPLLLLVTGAIVSKVAYFSCMGPNESVASAAIIGLLSTLVSIMVWIGVVKMTRISDPIGLYFRNLDMSSIFELGVLIFMYTFMSAVGGIVYYFVAHGRLCKNECA